MQILLLHDMFINYYVKAKQQTSSLDFFPVEVASPAAGTVTFLDLAIFRSRCNSFLATFSDFFSDLFSN